MTTSGEESTPEKRALLEAYEAVLRTEAERKAVQAHGLRRGRQISGIILTGGLIMLGIGAYAAIAKPAWLIQPPPPAARPAVRDASLRIAMYMQAQRIERFRAARGRLPQPLAEAGGSVPAGLSYRVTDSTEFTLVGVDGPMSLTLRSTDSLPLFLRNSFAVVSDRSAR